MPQMDAEVLAAMRAQYNKEQTNALAYEALASSLRNEAWWGFADFMHKSAAEEREHADRIAEYVIDRGDWVRSPDPDLPTETQGDPASCVRAAIELEESTTLAIASLHLLAWNKVDLQTCTMLLWFVEEQTKSTGLLMDIQLWLDGATKDGLLVLDDRMKGLNP